MAAATRRLRGLYAKRWYLRIPDEARRRQTPEEYKRGYELRFRARGHSELKDIRSLLRAVGIRAGRPYLKRGRPVLPIYGANRVLQAILYLGLKLKPPRRHMPLAGQPARRGRLSVARRPRPLSRPPTHRTATAAVANRRRRKLIMRLAICGPLNARELSAAGSQLVHLRRHGIVAAPPTRNNHPRVWALTPKGMREARLCRRAPVRRR